MTPICISPPYLHLFRELELLMMTSWAQQQTDNFFRARTSPSQTQCDEIARSLFNASTVNSVESPGSMSYTVVCGGCAGPEQDIIVSFREPGATLDEGIIKLAKGIHGELVPEYTCHGTVEDTEPLLHIYSMPYLRGSSCIEVLACEVDMDSHEEAKHIVFIRHLARYFARCWYNTQPTNSQTTEAKQGVHTRLSRLMEEPSQSVLPKSLLSELIDMLPSLFSQEYPQVLTHNDFSVTNILVDESKFDITGIVDWSLATVMPFGMDLDILFLTTGFMTIDGWHDYTCKSMLRDTFWEEFWAISGVKESDRDRVRSLAEAAGQIGAILRFLFRRNEDGSPSEEILIVESRVEQLKAWFGI